MEEGKTGRREIAYKVEVVLSRINVCSNLKFKFIMDIDRDKDSSTSRPSFGALPFRDISATPYKSESSNSIPAHVNEASHLNSQRPLASKLCAASDHNDPNSIHVHEYLCIPEVNMSIQPFCEQALQASCSRIFQVLSH